MREGEEGRGKRGATREREVGVFLSLEARWFGCLADVHVSSSVGCACGAGEDETQHMSCQGNGQESFMLECKWSLSSGAVLACARGQRRVVVLLLLFIVAFLCNVSAHTVELKSLVTEACSTKNKNTSWPISARPLRRGEGLDRVRLYGRDLVMREAHTNPWAGPYAG